MTIDFYFSVYRRKNIFNVDGTMPLLNIYYREKSKIKFMIRDGDMRIEYEEMFYLRMAKGKRMTFESVWSFLKYYADKYDSLEELLRCDVDIDSMHMKKYNPLMYAVSNRYIKIVENLVRAGCLLDLVNCDGNTALIIASSNGLSTMFEMMANPFIQKHDVMGMLGTFFFSIMGNALSDKYKLNEVRSFVVNAIHTKIARILICAKCSLDIQNNIGRTAFIEASFYKNYEIVRMLVGAKCLVDIKDMNGKTALDTMKDNNSCYQQKCDMSTKE